jgi:autotransporter-associated beta strand protein
MKPKSNNRLIAGLLTGKNLMGLGSLMLTCGFAQAANLYWDANGATAGSGNAGGLWEGSNWTSDSTGSVLTGPWTDSNSAVFSAGTDGTGDWTVTLGATVSVASILFEEAANTRNINGGTINIGGGTIDSTVNGTGAAGNNGRDVNMNSLLAGSGGLTIAAHGSHLANNGGGGSEFRLGNAGNSFSGGLTITNGLVSWNNNGNLGHADNVITLNGGGLLYTSDPLIVLPRAVQIGANGGTFRLYGGKNVYCMEPISNVSGVGTTTIRRTDGGTLRIYGSMAGFTGTFINGGGDTHFLVPNANLSGTDLQSEGGGFSMNGGGTAVVNKITSGNDFNIDNGTTVDVDTGNIVLTGGGFYRTNVGAPGKLTSSTGTLTFASGAASGDLSTGNPQIHVEITDSGATPVSLVKNNVGNLILNQQNTYTGTTTINAGRLDLKNPGGFSTGAVTVNSGGQVFLMSAAPLANNLTINGNGPTGGTSFGAIRFASPSSITGSLNVASASRIGADNLNTGTIAGILTGTAALEKTGAGTVAITGDASGYTGAVTVSAGTLNVGSILGGSVSAIDAASVAGEGTVGGLTLGVTVGSGLLIDPVSADALKTTNLTVNGVTTVRMTTAPPAGTVDLIKYTGTLTMAGTADDRFALLNETEYRTLPTFADTGSAITMTMAAGANLVWVGNVDGNWDLTTSNWLNGAASDVFYSGDNVLFDDTGLIKTVNMNRMISPATITFNNSTGNDYIVGTNGNPPDIGWTGPTNIVKNGTGTVNVQGWRHNFTGTVTINDGVYRALGANEILGNCSSVTINDSVNGGGQLDMNGQNLGSGRHYTLTIAGDGPNGLGAITNSGANNTNENAGLLNLTLSANAGVGGSGGRFDIGRSSGTFGSINGNGFTLTKSGTNIVCMRGPATNITYSVSAGTLKFEDYNSASGTNPITVNGGTLQGYGPRTFPNTLNFADGTKLDNDGGGNQVWTGPINLTGAAGTNVNFTARNGWIQLDGAISGESNITVTNTGTNILFLTGTGNNTYTGSTTFTGTLSANTNGQFVLAKTGAVAIPGDLYISASGSRAVVSTILDNQFGSGSVVRFNGAFDGRWELKGTTQTVAGIDNSGSLTGFYNAIQHSEFGTPAQVDAVSDLIVNTADLMSYSYNGALRDQGGTVNLVKSGPGIQALSGTLIDYRGTTNVTAGRLIFNSDDSWTSAINISAGAVCEVNITSTTEPYENRFAGFTLTGGGSYMKTGPGTMSMGWGDGTPTIMATVAMSSGALIDIAEGTMRFDYGRQTSWTNNKSDLNIGWGATLDLWDNNNDGIIVDSLDGGGYITRSNHGQTGNLTVGVDNGDGDYFGSISNASGKTNLIKKGTGTQTLSGLNTYSGDTTVDGGTLVLASGGSLKFTLANGGGCNKILGTGAVTLDGSFEIDTSAVTDTSGVWTLVNTGTLTCTFGSSFSPSLAVDWTENAGVWSKTDGNRIWTFSEATGQLTLSSSITYASWIDGFFSGETNPAIIGPDADPDKDGITNAVEMVLGGNPATGMDTALLPTIELVEDPAGLPAGDYFLFTYRRTDGSVAAGVTAGCQYDVDLVAPWSQAVNGVDGVVILEDDDYALFVPPATATDRVRVYVPRGTKPKLFGHLNATVP